MTVTEAHERPAGDSMTSGPPGMWWIPAATTVMDAEERSVMAHFRFRCVVRPEVCG